MKTQNKNLEDLKNYVKEAKTLRFTFYSVEYAKKLRGVNQ